MFTGLLQSNKEDFIQLAQDILDSNFLLIGEIHGVKENAFLYYSLFKLFEFNTIALAYPESLEKPLTNFLETGVFPIHASTENMSDGNVNKTYLLMLKQLHTDNLLERIVFIDPDDKEFSHWNDKEKAMFENIKSRCTEGKTLIITGNLHTKTDPFESRSTQPSESGTLIPLGYHLRTHYGNLPICEIKYHSGQFYNFGIKDFPKSHTPEYMLYKRNSAPKMYDIHINKASSVDTF